MTKPPAINGDEQDCFYARRMYCYLARAGAASRIKRAYRRRWRRMARAEIAEALASA